MYKPVFDINDLIQITNAKLINNAPSGVFSISTDTRTITENDVYLALCGNVFDGHDFVIGAFKKGIKLAIIDKHHEALFIQENYPFLVVEDTQEAYLKIAKAHKDRQNAKIIAVTGSSGKTTTKELFYAVFNSKYKTQKSLKNHNNEIGLCQTLLSIEPDTQYCIVEMGMRAMGEIDLLAKYANPDISIITNAGSAHIGILGSLENIAKAKCEVANYLSGKGLLVAHNNEMIKNNLKSGNYKKIFYDMNEATIIERKVNFSKFLYKNNEFILPDGADYNVLNSLSVINVALEEGFLPEEINKGLLGFKNIEFRNESYQLKSGATIISDCYNANPESACASLKNLAQIYSDKKVVIVFGDMLELGEFELQYHKQIGELINSLNVNYFVSVGKLAKITAAEVINTPKRIFENVVEAAEFLPTIMDKNTVVFLKASRGMQFEKILEIIREK